MPADLTRRDLEAGGDARTPPHVPLSRCGSLRLRMRIGRGAMGERLHAHRKDETDGGAEVSGHAHEARHRLGRDVLSGHVFSGRKGRQA